jgi:hypothetical protein
MQRIFVPRLGRHVVIGACKLPSPHRPRIRLSSYIDKATIPPSPPSVDYTAPAMSVIQNVEGNDSVGDCHDEKTEVLTEHGWRLWTDYDGSSLLGTMNTATGMLEFQTPISIRRRPHHGPMVFSSHKRLDFALTPNHRMLVSPYHIPKPYIPNSAHYGKMKFLPVGALPHRGLIPGATRGFVGTRLLKLSVGSREWNGTDFIKLLSLIISDGYVRSDEHNRNVISFCCFNEDRYEEVAKFAHSLDIREQPSRRGVWTFTDADLARWLRVNAYTGDVHHSPFKRIPDLIKVADTQQIHEFLASYGDQKHDVSEEERCQFYTSSKRLADDLQELLLRIGERASIYEREPRHGGVNQNGRDIIGNFPEHVVSANKKTDVTIMRSTRNPGIEFDEYHGEVFCATVPNSTLVTRRNGKILISGNCVLAEEAHFIGVVTGNAGSLYSYTVAQTLAAYSAITGYNPAIPSTDQGTDPIAALNYFTQNAYADGTKLAGYAEVDATNQAEVQFAINAFGNLKMWVGLPNAWISTFPSSNGFVWDVAPTNPNQGHCIGSPSYNSTRVVGVTSQGVQVMTWGLIGTVTWPALAALFTDSAGGGLAVRVTPDWIVKNSQKTPSGFAYADLCSDFNALFGKSIPVPVMPPPLPTPVPVGPPAAGVTLAQAQAWGTYLISRGRPLLTKATALSLVNTGLANSWPKSSA